jgi:hypothetical protein
MYSGCSGVSGHDGSWSGGGRSRVRVTRTGTGGRSVAEGENGGDGNGSGKGTVPRRGRGVEARLVVLVFCCLGLRRPH